MTTLAAEVSSGLAGRLRSARALPLLGALSAVQLALAAVFALHEPHNGFVWYSGGDSTEYWTAAWSLAHGAIPQSIVGYGVPVLWAWVPLVTGQTLVSGLPVIVVVQALVLVPLVLVLVWAVADLLFGRLFAWWAAAAWIAAPLLLLAGLRGDYAGEFATMFLAPHWYGLELLADLPATAAVLAVVWATLRLLQRPTVEDGLLAGVLLGVAVGVKPANGFVVPALLVLLVGIRRVAPLAAYAAGVAPALVTLTIWKVRGLGSLPLNNAYGHPTRSALGVHPVLAVDTQKYLQLDWGWFQHELGDLAEVFWSLRVLEFLAVAGIVAAVRRAPLKGAFLAVWFASFCIVKGSSPQASISTVSYWRLVEPGLPAYVLLAAAIVFLLPRNGARWPESRPLRPLPGGRRLLAAAVAVFAIVPLLVVGTASPWSSARYVRSEALVNDAPLSGSLDLAATVEPRRIRLSWAGVSSGRSRVYFALFRAKQGDGCISPPLPGARICTIDMDLVATTRATQVSVPKTAATYRVGLMANYRDATDGSDLMLMGPPLRVP